jgi:hypothetical protein
VPLTPSQAPLANASAHTWLRARACGQGSTCRRAGAGATAVAGNRKKAERAHARKHARTDTRTRASSPAALAHVGVLERPHRDVRRHNCPGSCGDGDGGDGHDACALRVGVCLCTCRRSQTRSLRCIRMGARAPGQQPEAIMQRRGYSTTRTACHAKCKTRTACHGTHAALEEQHARRDKRHLTRRSTRDAVCKT